MRTRSLFLAPLILCCLLLGGKAQAQCGDLPAGSLDSCFRFYGQIDTVGPYDLPPIYTVAVESDSSIFIGGEFSIPDKGLYGLARLKANGTLDTGFSTTPVKGDIHSILIQPDGKLVVSGVFGLGQYHLKNMFRFYPDGKLDSTFIAINGEPDGVQSYLNDEVSLLDSGKLLVTCWEKAVYQASPSTISYYQGNFRLNADGSEDTSYNSIVDRAAIGRAEVYPSGSVIYPYNSVGNPPLERRTSDGFTDSVFMAKLEEVEYLKFRQYPFIYRFKRVYVSTLRVCPNGQIYFGGLTDFYNGIPDSTLNKSLFGRLNADGTLDATFDTSGFTGSLPMISDLYLQPDGDLIVLGTFTGYRGDSVPGICRLKHNGSLDTSFHAGTGINGVAAYQGLSSFPFILRIIPAPNNTAYIVGNYQGYNGSGTPYLNRISIKPRGIVTGTPATRPRLQPIALTPSPTSGRLTIQARGYSGPVEVLSAMGRTVQQLTMSGGTLTTDLSGIPAGLYEVRCGRRQARLIRQ